MKIRIGPRRRLTWLLGLLAIASALLLTADLVRAQDVIWHRISHELADGDNVHVFATSPDRNYAVYIAGGARNFLDDIYSVPIEGGTPVRLNPPLSGLRQIYEFQISPDSQWVVYIADQDTDNVFELYSVPIDGSSAPVKLNGPMAGSGVLPVFVTNNVPGVFKFTPDSRHVIYVADQDETGVNELYSAPVDGSVPPIKLSDVGHSGGLSSSGHVFALTPDGSRVIYIAAQNLPGVFELFSVPTAGNAAAFRLNAAMIAGGDVRSFQISADGTRVVYLADQDVGNVIELFSVPVNGGIVNKLNAALSGDDDVRSAEITPDSRVVLFSIRTLSAVELWRAPIDGSTAAVQLSDRSRFVISPDGAHVAYEVSDGSGGTRINRFGLNDGRTATLVPSFVGQIHQIRITPDSQRVVYIARVHDGTVLGLPELFSVPFNGSTQPDRLNASVANVNFFDFLGDGEQVFFAAFQSGRLNLFQVPVDGSREPIQINASFSEVRSGITSPDGRRILYRSNQLTAGVFELFSAFDAPEVAFTNDGYVLTEDGSSDTAIVVARFGIPDAPASVRVAFTDDTATGGATLGPGIDYENNALTIPFAAGQITATVPVNIHDDGVAEPVELFSVQLFEPEKVLLALPDQAQIALKDTNETPLLSDSSLSIQENRPNGTVVGALEAGGQEGLAFAIKSGNINNAFRLEGDELVVNNSSALDFENLSQFVLNIEAATGDGSFDVARVTVQIIDVNEPPTAKDAEISIREDTPTGTKIGSIAASDPDTNDVLTFSTGSRVFAVDSTSGTLFVRDGAALDFATNPVHTFTVNVVDQGGLKATATVKVQLIQVVKEEPAAIRISSLSPTSAVAGGSSFWLRLDGKNFTRNSRVRWNGSTRSTYFSSSTRIYGYIPSTDIAKTGTAVIDVVDGTQKSQDQLKFSVVSAKVGISELAFESPDDHARSLVGQTTVFTLTWTHTSLTWREMDVMDLRIRDDEKTILWIRYSEALTDDGDASTLLLLNGDGTPAGSGHFGEDKVLENSTVILDLRQASFVGSGPTGSSVSVRLPVIFTDAAVGQRYNLELFAVDDQGDKQGPDLAGTWEVIHPTIYLPLLSRN